MAIDISLSAGYITVVRGLLITGNARVVEAGGEFFFGFVFKFFWCMNK